MTTVLEEGGSLVFPFISSGLSLVATTGIAGFALQNGTPNILSWTAPNDGTMHRVAIFSDLVVTTNETGGLIQLNMTDPASGSRQRQMYAAGLTAGFSQIGGGGPLLTLVAPGSVSAIVQASALTVGAAVLWAEIWGS